jgi:predicted nucleic acid-binding protein
MFSLYLDLCCYNRPFDDQSQTRVRMETEAKLHLQSLAKQRLVALIWSYVLDFENERNPIRSRKESIALWRSIASHNVAGTSAILTHGEALISQYGLKSFDALHLACACMSKADMFVTTDDQILRKLKNFEALRVVPPIEALSTLEKWYESRN